MAIRKLKKDPGRKSFDKEQMYAKIMPSFTPQQPAEPLPAPEPDAAADAGRRQSRAAQAPQPRYLLRNYMEDIVLEKLDHTMKMLKACECERCKKDVMALALNSLPNAYMTIEPQDVEEQVRRLRAGVEIKVSAALIKAVQEVKASPRHT